MSETEIQELRDKYDDELYFCIEEEYRDKVFNYFIKIIESDRQKIQEMSKRLNLNYGGGFTEEEITIAALRKEIQALTDYVKRLENRLYN